MIDQDTFVRIIEDAKANVFLAPHDAMALIQSLAELDAQMVRAEGALGIVMRSLKQEMIQMAQDVCVRFEIEDGTVASEVVDLAVEHFTNVEKALYTFFANQYEAENGTSAEVK